MSTSLQGTVSSSGHTGLQYGSGDRAAHKPALRLGQTPQEQLISAQIRKLTVRPFVDAYELRTDEIPDDTRTLLKGSWSNVRYDPISPTKHPPERSAGATHDQSEDRHRFKTIRWIEFREKQRRCGQRQ